jgi:DNA-binding beta-propeller fold protein YncE
MTMHPDMRQLAAYIDGALAEADRATLRAHVLTCSTCAARLERLHGDARQISATLSATNTAPDVRAAVRARLRRRWPGEWLVRGSALAGALAALLLFALLIGSRSGTVGRVPDRLFVTDSQNGQLVVLDAYTGERLGAVDVGSYPTAVRYDRRLDRLYVLIAKGVVAVDQRTLSVVNRWSAPAAVGTNAGMVLAEDRGRLYISQPDAAGVTSLDAATLRPSQTFSVGTTPTALALTPDAQRLFVFDQATGMLWMIDLSNGNRATRLLAQGDSRRTGWLALSEDGRTIYLLRGGASIASAEQVRAGAPPELWRVAVDGGQAQGPFLLDKTPPLWDLVLLDADHLAIARGDGLQGGVDIVATASLSVTARLDPSYDEHHLVVGPRGAVFALNWLHGTITRYTLGSASVAWRTSAAAWQPWAGVFVPGGWRWPW